MADDTDRPEEETLAPAPIPASRPSRAKRHLRLVTASGEPETKSNKDQRKKGSASRSAADPETGLTDKQTAFVEGITKGLSLSDSYRAAYDTSTMSPKSVHEEACRLMTHPKISSRLEEISREKEAQRRMLTASDAAAAIETFRQMMTSAKNDAVKVRAAELLAKAAGIFTDKVEIEDKTDRSTADLERSIREKLAKLGLTG